jgi:hypothetical protein
MGKYLFKKDTFSESLNINDNFLFQHDNKFVMDNHRLALWCWYQAFKNGERYNLIHVDAHPDMSISSLNHFVNSNFDIRKMSLDEYRNVLDPEINQPLFRWDNYLRFFMEKKEFIFETSISFTHKLGSSAALKYDYSTSFLLKIFGDIFLERKYINEKRWIVNLDMDYFVSNQPDKILMFSDEYIDALTECIIKGCERKMIEVVTVALSPECCGSWENSMKVFSKFNKNLKIYVNLKK